MAISVSSLPQDYFRGFMRITVVGMGYVGLSNAALLARHHTVMLLDIVQAKVDALNAHKSPIHDTEIEKELASGALNLTATLDQRHAFESAELVIIATSTNFNEVTQSLDTRGVATLIADIRATNKTTPIVIRSTIPIGFTKRMNERGSEEGVLFMPEFLREGSALRDNQYPSRIVIGGNRTTAEMLKKLFLEVTLAKDVPVILMGSCEAEAVKLFANAYLAMRVAFLNELDNFAARNQLSCADIIEGMGHDPRIGSYYNNPSFGYGGYCLPKDSKQLLNQFYDVPQQLIDAIVSSNRVRMHFIASEILAKKPRTVGIYRLAMKAGSDNYREASTLGVIEHLQQAGVEVLIYEPMLPEGKCSFGVVLHNLEALKQRSDIIAANRISDELKDCAGKLYTRDIYGRD